MKETVLMKILLLGSGGREHALAWKISQSSQLEKLYVAPGNAGTSDIAENIAIDLNNFAAIGNFAVQHDIEMIKHVITLYTLNNTSFHNFK